MNKLYFFFGKKIRCISSFRSRFCRVVRIWKYILQQRESACYCVSMKVSDWRGKMRRWNEGQVKIKIRKCLLCRPNRKVYTSISGQYLSVALGFVMKTSILISRRKFCLLLLSFMLKNNSKVRSIFDPAIISLRTFSYDW